MLGRIWNKTRTIVTCLGVAITAYVLSIYTPFLSLEGLIIVIGGSVANALMSYRRADVKKAFQSIKQLMKKADSKDDKLSKDIMQLVMWAYIVQTQDLIGLEKENAKKLHDPLMRYGLDLVVTGYASDKVREMLHTASETEFERRCSPVAILRNMASAAPAFGMVGTLVGMVTLLHNIGPDIANIEGGLAIAMLSTLYGIIIARLICLPAADKLLQQEEQMHFRNFMISEGLALLADKPKPFYMQDRLNSFLEPTKQMEMNNYMHGDYRTKLSLAA